MGKTTKPYGPGHHKSWKLAIPSPPIMAQVKCPACKENLRYRLDMGTDTVLMLWCILCHTVQHAPCREAGTHAAAQVVFRHALGLEP